jgi:hypothetical protein
MISQEYQVVLLGWQTSNGLPRASIWEVIRPGRESDASVESGWRFLKSGHHQFPVLKLMAWSDFKPGTLGQIRTEVETLAGR